MTAKTKRVQQRMVKSARKNSNRVHITPRPNGWAVRKEGNLQASKVLTTQEQAIEVARGWVDSGKATSVIVHRKDGKYRISA